MMTPKQLAAARDSLGTASQAATDMWGRIVARVESRYAGTVLDLIGAEVGTSVGLPDSVLQEGIVRAALALDRDEVMAGLKTLKADDSELEAFTQFHGSLLVLDLIRKGLLDPVTLEPTDAASPW